MVFSILTGIRKYQLKHSPGNSSTRHDSGKILFTGSEILVVHQYPPVLYPGGSGAARFNLAAADMEMCVDAG
jgi:hypothetical protein